MSELSQEEGSPQGPAQSRGGIGDGDLSLGADPRTLQQGGVVDDPGLGADSDQVRAGDASGEVGMEIGSGSAGWELCGHGMSAAPIGEVAQLESGEAGLG